MCGKRTGEKRICYAVACDCNAAAMGPRVTSVFLVLASLRDGQPIEQCTGMILHQNQAQAGPHTQLHSVLKYTQRHRQVY